MRFSDKSKAGFLFFLSSSGFMTVLMMAEAVAPGYSMNTNAISDLGTIGPSSLMFNTSIFLVGIMNIAGGYLYYRTHRKRHVLAMFTIAGIGAMGVGIFTLNTPGLHGIFALTAFLFFNLQALAVSGMLSFPLKYISVALGILGLAYIAVMFVSDSGIIDLFGPIGHGGTERMIVYPSIIWLTVFGGYLLGEESKEKSAEVGR
jgi:hypothetical membrane protein